jgi:MinD superfamily P-loop ATPase
VDNIVYEDKTIHFQNRCTGCLGCLHLCPVRAINYKNITKGKLRYMNPFVDTSKAKKLKEN